MPAGRFVPTLRQSSLGLAVIALTAPPLWAWRAMDVYAEESQRARGFVCGNPMIGILLMALFASGLLSFAALTLGGVALRRVPAPRPGRRWVELSFLALPLLACVAVVLATVVLTAQGRL